jgi:DnaA family protein
MATVVTQLPLRLSPQDVYQLDNYFFANGEIRSAIDDFCHLAQPDYVYLWGSVGTGKTHLLIALTAYLQNLQHQVAYLSFKELVSTASPALLSSLDSYQVIVLDDVDKIIGLRDWEEALFHCFNQIKSAGKKLLLASTLNASSSDFGLADIQSRLATGLTYHLPELNDDEKQQALILHAHSKGLVLAEEVTQYLLRRYGRDMNSLMAVLKRLDNASLAAQRKLTIPFVSQVLADD